MRSYTVAFKIEVAEEAVASKNKTGTARKYGLQPVRVREWVRDLDKLRLVPQRKSYKLRKIKPNCGRYPQLESVYNNCNNF
jgi:transposase-like protein